MGGELAVSWNIGLRKFEPSFRFCRFIYRAKLRGEIVYIGRAVEYSNGGLRKRLSDYTRESDSSRKHTSGQLMNEHASQLSIDILITGSNPEAVDAAKQLEQYFIGTYRPAWNKMFK